MSNLYYLAFILGFSTAAFSSFDTYQEVALGNQTEVRAMAEPTETTTACDKSLSANFCYWGKK